MPVPSNDWPPLRRLPIVLLVVLAGCRTTPPATPVPQAPPEPPPIELPPPPDVVEETRRAEEALETVEIELAPAEGVTPADSTDLTEPALPAAAAPPADRPDPPALA